jgi:hypothetical protein
MDKTNIVVVLDGLVIYLPEKPTGPQLLKFIFHPKRNLRICASVQRKVFFALQTPAVEMRICERFKLFNFKSRVLLATLRKSVDKGNRCPDWNCIKSFDKEQSQIYSKCSKHSFTKPFDQNS